MNQYDLLIKNGKVRTAVDSFEAEIGVSEGKIVAIGQNLGKAEPVSYTHLTLPTILLV